jgi:hypothetical protein
LAGRVGVAALESFEGRYDERALEQMTDCAQIQCQALDGVLNFQPES